MFKCYFDGCCEPYNPGGTASYGIVILRDNEKIHEASQIFRPSSPNKKDTSNNLAEYSGFKAILQYLINNQHQDEPIEIFGDSQLVIRQMSGDWNINQGIYVPLAHECRKMLGKFPHFRLHWIPREENSLADELSKGVLLKAGIKFRIQPR